MVEKQQFVNDTNQVIGYNCFRPGTNEPWASSLLPGETVWLSEDEQRMTANAPRSAADNPFLTGALKPVTDERPIPATNERPIAGIVGGAVQRPPAPKLDGAEPGPSEPEVPSSIFESTEEDRAAKARIEAERQGRLGAIPASQVVEVEQGSLAGDIGGEDASDPELDEGPAPEEENLGGAGELDGEDAPEAIEEEQAVDHREETGAAVDPAGDPPEGEYARHEEVGDPEAPEEAGTPFRNPGRSGDSGTPRRRR